MWLLADIRRADSDMLFCRRIEDRDVNASRNIMMACAVRRFGHPGEAMKGNPESRRRRAILRVDGWKLHFGDYVLSAAEPV